MPVEARLLGAFTLPLLAVLVATPVAIRVAERLDFHDRPVGYKGHARPTPYLGGTALVAGFLLGAVVLGGGFSRLAPIAGGALFLWVVGTLDDRRTVTPQLRVLAAIGAATLLFAGGLGWSVFGQPSADYVLTVLWVVGLVNAFNLMDNMDGASSTIASFSALGAAVLAISLGDPVLGALALGLVGACLGFLPYNLARPSARIFLGDGGSMPIGFVVAATIMALPLGGEAGWHRLLAAVLLAGLPILDTTLVMVSRHRAGVPLLQGGTDHITHRLRRRLPSARAVALVLAGAQALLCLIAFSVTQLGDLSVAVVWATLVVGAAAVVATMERDAWRPERSSVSAAVADEAAPGKESPGTGFEPAPVPVAGPPPSDPQRMGRLELALLLLIGLGLGLSPLAYGFYGLAIWGPIALMLLAVLLGLVIARPATLRISAVAAVAGLVALWGWALLSTGWAESGERALTQANRWMLYAALLGVLLFLLRTDRLGKVLLATTTAAVLGVGVWMLARMAVGDGGELFLVGRLEGLLGYINGQAAYLLLGFWPLVSLAEYARRPPVRGLAAAGATLLAALVVLTQSRAVVPALLVSTVVLLVAVPGRQRRAWALLVIATGIAVLAKPLLAVYASMVAGAPSPETIRAAALATLLVAAAVGVVWALLSSLGTQLVGSSAPRRRQVLATGWALLATVLVVGAVGLVSVVGNPAAGVRAQFEAFTELEVEVPGEGATRLSQGAGSRYDYWRVAVNQFLDEPVRGLGAGGYTRTYFRERQTSEDIRQPHSLQLQTLAELGVVGGAALLLFLGGVAAGFLRRARAARRDRSEAVLAVAAGGLFCTWLVHTSVDWLHLIPGVTGIALCAAAVLVGPWPRVRAAVSPTRWHRVLLGGLAVLVFLAAVHLGRATLADRELRTGQAALEAGQPQRALAQARDSLELNPEVLNALYLEAAALARGGDYAGARAPLIEATRREPSNFVPWVLLGDIAVRRGDLALASENYGRAARLNPLDPTLESLARDPQSALP